MPDFATADDGRTDFIQAAAPELAPQPTTIYWNDGAVNVIGCAGCQEDGRPDHIIWTAPATRRDARQDFYAALRVTDQRGVHGRVHIAWRDGVYVDAATGPI